MTSDDDSFAALCETLREEAGEQIERIGAILIDLEKGGTGAHARALLDEAFRQAHNLKGAAGSLGFPTTARLAHALESALADVRERPGAATPELFDLVHRGLGLVPLTLEVVDAAPPAEVTLFIQMLDHRRASLRPLRPSAGPVERTVMEIPGRTASAPPEDAPMPVVRGGTDPIGNAKTQLHTEGKQAPRPAPPPDPRFTPPPDHALPAPATPAGPRTPPPATPLPPTVGTGTHPPTPLTDVDLGLRTPVEPTTDAEATPQSATAAMLEEALARPRNARPADETLRVSTKKLGALMAQVGELLAARLRTDQRLAELKGILGVEEDLLDRRVALRVTLQEAAPDLSDPVVARMAQALDESTATHRQLVRQLRDLVRAFETDALQSTILSGELQEDIRRIQTFPLASVLDPLPRAVRNMARDAGKDVELVVVGGDLELDKKVLEALRDPLYHLLRNAVDHGIESPDDRRAAGKPPQGKITLRAEHRGDAITITVEDDGPGIDLEAVRRRARERGLLSERTAEQANEQLLLDLLFSPGFTTRKRVGSLSGRGVGLDAVRTSIEELHGNVSVQTRRGRGALIAISLPLTIYVVHALILRVGTHELAIPISSVHRIMRVRALDVITVEQSPAVLVDGGPVALVPLSELLGVAADPRGDAEHATVIVVGVGDQRCALAVDEIVGDQTVLAKNLEPPLVRVPNISGATVRGDGTVLLTLNPIDLLRRASLLRADHAFFRGADARAARRARLLLVDDSFTTRALERSVLEAAGFEVTAVASGEDALLALAGPDAYDGVVSDVAMAGVDGFELCRRVRGDARRRELPVVLVTSLGSAEDRRRGMEAGADAYVVKSEFDHEWLVAKLRELLGRE